MGDRSWCALRSTKPFPPALAAMIADSGPDYSDDAWAEWNEMARGEPPAPVLDWLRENEDYDHAILADACPGAYGASVTVRVHGEVHEHLWDGEGQVLVAVHHADYRQTMQSASLAQAYLTSIYAKAGEA